MMLERPAIIQNELDRAEQLAPYECKHGLGCFCEKCSFKKRAASRATSTAHRAKKRAESKAPVTVTEPIENIEESAPKLNAIGKPYGASYDPNYRVKTLLTNIKRLYAPMKPAPPSSPCETLLEKGWLQATPKAKRQFLRKYWDEILREKSAADDDCTEHTTEDASLVAVELAV